jgi:hypothetical protein
MRAAQLKLTVGRGQSSRFVGQGGAAESARQQGGRGSQSVDGARLLRAGHGVVRSIVRGSGSTACPTLVLILRCAQETGVPPQLVVEDQDASG